MGRKRQRVRRSRSVESFSDRADLPPDVAEFMAIFDASGPGWTAVPGDGGTLWSILTPGGDVAMEFASASPNRPAQSCDHGAPCMKLAALWADPEFCRQADAGLVDVYGRPLHPECRDFFAEQHQAHDH